MQSLPPNTSPIISFINLFSPIVCDLSCEPGYAVAASCSICVLINICEAVTPCDNNGICILGSQPDEYICNCTNIAYTGTNCTGM